MSFNEYYFVFLRRNGDYHSKGKEEDKKIGERHFKFINKMIEERFMIAAGPLDGAGGLYFFDTEGKEKEDILKILQRDDSIKYEMFIPEIHRWHIPKNVLHFTYEDLKRIEQSKEEKDKKN